MGRVVDVTVVLVLVGLAVVVVEVRVGRGGQRRVVEVVEVVAGQVKALVLNSMLHPP